MKALLPGLGSGLGLHIVAASFAVTNDVAAIVTALIGTITIVLSVVNYIDKRAQHKVDNYAAIVTVHLTTLNKRIDDVQRLLVHSIEERAGHDRKEAAK